MNNGALAIDAMGGDRGPEEVIAGIALAHSLGQIARGAHSCWP